MKALILAGGTISNGDPLWEESKGLPKALIDLHGKPMVQWIIDEVNQVEVIEQIYLAGLDPGTGLVSNKTITYFPDQGGVIENLLKAVEIMLQEDPETSFFLTISADIPLVTHQIMDAVIHMREPEGYNIYYNVIEKGLMESKFPGLKRTYMRFADGRFCGGDMHLFNAKTIAEPALFKFVKYRKSPLRLISLIGIGSILRMMTFPPSLKRGGAIIRKRTHIAAVPVNCHYPELGVDIDKPEQLAIIRKLFEEKINPRSQSDASTPAP